MLFRGRSSFSSVFSLFIVFVMTFSIISWSMCLESKAASTYVTHNPGYHETNWVRCPSVKVWLDGDYEIGMDNISYSHSVKDQYVFDVFVDIPMDLNLFGGQYDIPEGIKSLLLNVDGGVKYTVDEYKVNDQDGLNSSTINLVKASTYIYGKEYNLSIPSTSSNFYSNTDVPIDYWVYVDDVPDGGFFNAGTFSLHLEFQLYVDMSVVDYESIVVTPMYNFYLDNGVTFVLFDKDTTTQEIQSILNDNNAKLDEGNSLQQESNDLQKEENETSKGILSKVTDFFGSFFDNLVNSVIGVFVPSTEDLSALFDRLNQFFSDTFGFLYYPFDFIIQAFNVFLSSDSSTGLTFPGFSIMGYEVWGDLTYDLGADEVAGSIFSYVRIGTGAILSMFFVGYLRAFFEKRFGGGGS